MTNHNWQYIFYVSKEAVCGNPTSTISDHLPQVLFIPSMFSDNTATNRANAILYKVRDLLMQIFLNQYIMHYLNLTLTMLSSYGDKTSVQQTVATFSRTNTKNYQF